MTERQWKALLQKSEYVIDSKEGGVWVPTKSIHDVYFEECLLGEQEYDGR